MAQGWLLGRQDAGASSSPRTLLESPQVRDLTVDRFLGLPPGYVTEEDREGVGLEFHAAILKKP